MILRTLKEVREIRLRHSNRRLLIRDNAACRLAAELPDDALELAHARLTRIGADNLRPDTRTDTDVLRLQPILRTLTRQEVTACNLDFLKFGIAR